MSTEAAVLEMVVFLGNPGNEYVKTRHNAGRMLASQFDSSVNWQKKYGGLFARHPAKGIWLLQPETFMNESGESVAEAASFYKIPPEHILVAHDDLQLSLGKSALKFAGGLGGHNGLRSVKSALDSADFWRLRIGIGRPQDENSERDVSEWVLSGFTAAEAGVLLGVMDACAEKLGRLLSGETPKARAITCEPES
jgi:PTH1 family peptidyl-tRNA hydrolase